MWLLLLLLLLSLAFVQIFLFGWLVRMTYHALSISKCFIMFAHPVAFDKITKNLWNFTFDSSIEWLMPSFVFVFFSFDVACFFPSSQNIPSLSIITLVGVQEFRLRQIYWPTNWNGFEPKPELIYFLLICSTIFINALTRWVKNKLEITFKSKSKSNSNKIYSKWLGIELLQCCIYSKNSVNIFDILFYIVFFNTCISVNVRIANSFTIE